MSEYYHDIQILRFISITLVTLYHLNLNNNGYIGVDIFFVISGFIMNFQYSKVKYNTISFYCSRIRRLFPSSHTILTFYYYIYYNRNLYEDYKQCIIYNANAYFDIMKNDYFNPSSKSLFLHYWSLSVEMKYYTFCPLFISFMFLNIIISIYSISVCILRFSYYQLIPRLYEFNIGIISYNKQIFGYAIFLKYILIIILIYVSYVKYTFNVIIPFISVLVSYFFLIVRVDSFKCKLLEYFGNISYVIYLVHYPLTVMYHGSMTKCLVYIICISLIFNLIDINIQAHLKLKRSIYIIILFQFSTIAFIYIAKYKYSVIDNRLIKHSDYTFCEISLNDYRCYNNNKSVLKSIIVIGDSHSFPFLGVVVNFCRNRGILLYYKYIHTQYILDYNILYLEDINTTFCLIIYTNYIDERYNKYTFRYTNNIYKYFQYLLLYSMKIIYILPTPVLKKWKSCSYLRKKGNISIDNFILNTNYNYSKIEKMNNIEIINLTKRICYSHYCMVSFNNTCLFCDIHHINLMYYTTIVDIIINLAKNICRSEKIRNIDYPKYLLYKNKIHVRWHLKKKKCKIINLEVPF